MCFRGGVQICSNGCKDGRRYHAHPHTGARGSSFKKASWVSVVADRQSGRQGRQAGVGVFASKRASKRIPVAVAGLMARATRCRRRWRRW